MLQVNISLNAGGDSRGVDVTATGTITEITADLGAAIASLYNQIRHHNPEISEAFKQALIALVADPKTPLWDERLCAEGIMISVPNNHKEDI